MMSFMNEALDTLMKKVDRISKTGEIVDFHRLLHKVNVLKKGLLCFISELFCM